MKKVIISLIGLVVVLILIFLSIIPLWDSVRVKYSELNDRQQDLENLQQLTEKISRLKQEYQSLESEAEKVFLALPKEKDIPNLLIQFQALAAISGLSMESINFGQIAAAAQAASQIKNNATIIVDEEGFAMDVEKTIAPAAIIASSQSITSSLRSLNVEMTMMGTYKDFKKYLAALAKSVRSMDVKKISFNKISQEPIEGAIDNYNFNLSIIVYYQ